MCMRNTLTRFIYDTHIHTRAIIVGAVNETITVYYNDARRGVIYYIVNKRRRYFADAFRARATVNLLLGIIKKGGRDGKRT